MFILDTDHVTILQLEQGAEYRRLDARLSRLAPGEMASTVVSYEEQTRGWLSFVARGRTVAHLVEAYRRLRQHLEDWRRIPALPFDASAAVRYQELIRRRLRIGTMDLRIAATVLASGGILLTRNLRDFRQIPELPAEDWTA